MIQSEGFVGHFLDLLNPGKSLLFISNFTNASDEGTGITLTDNEIKDIIKVINSLENGRTLLKGTTKKITSEEGEFLNFLIPLMTAGLSLMKSVLTHLAKSVCYH